MNYYINYVYKYSETLDKRNLRVQVPVRELEIQTASDTCKFPLPSLYVTKKLRRATASAALLSFSL